MKFKLLFLLALLLSGGLLGCSTAVWHGSSICARQDTYVLSFPSHVKNGEHVVGFSLDVRNGTILALNRVPEDWVIDLCAAAPGSVMSGLPNHDASAFDGMDSLQRFVTVRKDRPRFDITGYIVLTKNFTEESTNYFAMHDFVLEKATKP